YVGDFAETLALVWPPKAAGSPTAAREAPRDLLSPLAGGERVSRLASGSERGAQGQGVPDLFGNVEPPHPDRPAGAARSGFSPPARGETDSVVGPSPRLSEVVERLLSASRLQGPRLIEGWLDQLDAIGRWALIKLVTGELRIGVSARLTKQALADLGG